MCFGTLNFVAKFFPAAKTCKKCGHEPNPMFSMSDMTVPVSFADNTFVHKGPGIAPYLSISYAFLLLAFLSASSACEDDSQSCNREGKQERDPVIRLVTSAWQLMPVTV